METYLTLLYVTLDQELALKDFFNKKGWTYCKPDLGVMTDKVGPFENPQAFSSKNGGIITYSLLTDDFEPAKTKKVVSKKRSAQVNISSAVPDIVKVEVSTTEEDDFPSQSDGFENDVGYDITENDDGDNDDDFADALNSTEEREEIDTRVAGVPNSPKKRGRPVRKLPKVEQKKIDKDSSGSICAGSSSADQEKVSASGRKRRRVAAKADATIASAMSEEIEETELKPDALMCNRSILPEKRPPPGVKRKCTMCSKEFTFQYNLDKHYKLAHDPDNPRKPKPKYQGSRQQCDICGSVFNRSDILLEHVRNVHQGIRRVKTEQSCTCDVCGKTFKRRTHLKEHTLVKHSGSRLPHACELCEKSFIRYRLLEAHMNKDHLKIKPFACSSCNSKFYGHSALEKHVRLKICQSDRVKKFKCIQCDKKFPDPQNLEMHMTAKHFGGAYSCVCGQVVKWSGSVAKHKRRCKAYQEYVAANGDTEDKLCNIIEVLYDDVLLENTNEHVPAAVESTDVPVPNASSNGNGMLAEPGGQIELQSSCS